MTPRAPRRSLAALLSVCSVVSLGCGSNGGDAPTPPPAPAPAVPAPTAPAPTAPAPTAPAAPTADPSAAPAPTDAVTPEPPPEAPAVAAPAPTGPPQLVLVHSHELLRSEERVVDYVLRELKRDDPTIERVDAGERSAGLDAWLAETQPDLRAAMPLGQARGSARYVIVVRFAPPEDNRAQGISGYGVIAGDPAQERLWARGDLAESLRGLISLLTDGGHP